MRFLETAAVAALWLASLALAAKGPTISSKQFDSRPADLFFFDDSDTVLTIEREPGIVYQSNDAGASWSKVSSLPDGEPVALYRSKFHPKLMIVIGRELRHWITTDRGSRWRMFESPYYPSLLNPVSIHAADPNKILFHAQEPCAVCTGQTFYTRNAFETPMQTLIEDRLFCNWVVGSPEFTSGDHELDDDGVLCSVKGLFSSKFTDSRLVRSKDYFSTEENSLITKAGKQVFGVANLANVKTFIVAATRSEGTNELALYITRDTNKWHRAHFGDSKLEQESYTLLDSTNYTVQVDVASGRYLDMGTLFSSDSEGQHFTPNVEYTNRSPSGVVDYERLTGNIQGIILVNTVKNGERIKSGDDHEKDIVSRVSFDDGRTFQDLEADGKPLHLHSITNQRNSGRVFSSPAPGIVMGVGNIGDKLGDYMDGDLYVSSDAGLSWKKALDGPHIYEMADSGGILVAVPDGVATDRFSFSLDYGSSWETQQLNEKLYALELTTVQDSTSLKLVLVSSGDLSTPRSKHLVYSLDFSSLGLGKCKGSDFEKWYTRLDENGKPTCLMGHKQWFDRRKADARCYIGLEFSDPTPSTEACDCVDEDFECDYNFMVDNQGVCQPIEPLVPPKEGCRDKDGKFEGPSGWRLIPGNDCKKNKLFEKKTARIERSCVDSGPMLKAGEIHSTVTTFPGKAFRGYNYLERKESSDGTDETVVLHTNERKVYISHDHGKSWETPIDDEIISIYPHPYFSDSIFFVTPGKKVYYSHRRCKPGTIHSFEPPTPVFSERSVALDFHSKNRDWLLWTGQEGCDDRSMKDCHPKVFVSKKGGRDWESLLPFVRSCQFMYLENYRPDEELVYCEQSKDEDPSQMLALVSSSDWFEKKATLFENVIGFATMPNSEFIVVASGVDGQGSSLGVDASVDGKQYARAKFPPNHNLQFQQAYTVLESTTHAIFMHVTENAIAGQEYGPILKSNSNGTAYVMSIQDVNRNTEGYVDFEKTSLQGVSLVNVVDNRPEVDKGARKRKKTMITHNDGADWSGLKGPSSKPLHLHGYTDRRDPGDTFSSSSGIGLLLGIGNEGDYLGDKADSNTYISQDGGISWKMARKGPHMWEFGDQGSIVVIVPEDTPTKSVFFTLDEGREWVEYKFSNTAMNVVDIATVPSDTSQQFLLFARSSGGKLTTVNLDFSRMRDRACKLPQGEINGPGSDYYLWTPQHPNQKDDCLFGHIARYVRKKPFVECYNGPIIPALHDLGENCTCSRRDFECDYNYERQPDGSCSLVPGLEKHDPMQICRDDPDAIEYWDVTGYRRIPLSTCQGGLELDLTGESHPCPGHEKEHEEKHRASRLGLVLAFTIPFLAAGVIGWYMWKYGNFTRLGHFQVGGDVNAGPQYGGSEGVRAAMGALRADATAGLRKAASVAFTVVSAVAAGLIVLPGALKAGAYTILGRFDDRFRYQTVGESLGDYDDDGDDDGDSVSRE